MVSEAPNSNNHIDITLVHDMLKLHSCALKVTHMSELSFDKKQSFDFVSHSVKFMAFY